MRLSRLLRRLYTAPIAFYRRYVSPALPRVCKYYPTCSSYAMTAIERFGVVKGTVMAVWRLLRCNPYSNGGVDYVPEKFGLYLLKHRRDER